MLFSNKNALLVYTRISINFKNMMLKEQRHSKGYTLYTRFHLREIPERQH